MFLLTRSVAKTDSHDPGDGGPKGRGPYEVRMGDSVESIAYEHGFFHETLLRHPANRELVEHRRDHNALLPGDRLTIPPKRDKVVSGALDRRHVFRRRGVPAMFRIQLYSDGRPRAHERFELEIDGVLLRVGETDADGRLECRVSPHAKRGRLLLGDDRAELRLVFGALPPVEELVGVQRRLANIGFYGGPADGLMSASTSTAIRAFRRAVGLDERGLVDDALREALARPFATMEP